MVGRVLRTWAINTANTLVFVLTWGHKVLHEGRYRWGCWIDWYRVFHCRPRLYSEPTTEKEICTLVANAGKVRVVGAGHSFNAAPLSDEVLLSLDRYNRVEIEDHENRTGCKVARVQAGVRLRHLNRLLLKKDAALSVSGSTDTQSIGGPIATDLHGTGRDHGFLSESLRSIRVVNSRGEANTFRPGDDVFHATIGAAGVCGVIIEAEILCEPAYNLRVEIGVVNRLEAEDNVNTWLDQNDHLSFYYFGGVAQTSA